MIGIEVSQFAVVQLGAIATVPYIAEFSNILNQLILLARFVCSSDFPVDVAQRGNVFGHGNDADGFLIKADRFVIPALGGAYLREARQATEIVWIGLERLLKVGFGLRQISL